MQKFLLALALAIFGFFLFILAVHDNRSNYSRDAVVVSGDHAFIPLTMDGTPEQNAVSILKALNDFEKDFNVRVIHYSISFQPKTAEKNAKTLGIWTTNAPKTRSPE